MAYVQFWKGLAADYNAASHQDGIYQCTDTGDTYIFGVKNSGSGGGVNPDFSNYPWISNADSNEEAIKILADKIAEYHPVIYTFTINPTPSDAIVKINGEIRNSVQVQRGDSVTWEVSREGYITQQDTEIVNSDMNKDITLQLQQYTFTINPTPSDAIVKINGEIRNNLTANYGTQITWEVSREGYITQQGQEVLSQTITKSIILEVESSIPSYLPSGLSIVDGSGKVHTDYGTWNEGLGLTGIGINSNGHSFIFAVANQINSNHQDDDSINTPKEWSAYLYGTSVGNGITSTSNKNTAESDFRSKENTDAIITAMGSTVETDNAARVCRNYSAGVIGVGQWDLPALGVLKIINDLRTSIISLMTTIGKSYWNSLLNNYWAWSSTEYDSNFSWGFVFGYQHSYDYSKNSFNFVVPVFTIS